MRRSPTPTRSRASRASRDTLAREYGVSKGDRVGLASANTVEYVLCYWATLSLGAILSNFNGWWTTPELAHGIELTEPVVVLADPTTPGIAGEIAAAGATRRAGRRWWRWRSRPPRGCTPGRP